MKKLYSALLAAFIMLSLTSCVTSEAATVAVAATEEYYDYGYNYVVVYIDGIANYRFWDNTYRRYWYRPVPRDRFCYIRHRPYYHHGRGPVYHHHRHYNVTPRNVNPHHSNGNFHNGNRRNQNSTGSTFNRGNSNHTRPSFSQRSSTRHSSSGGQTHGRQFGGRR